jgi:hypothetical protein
MRITENRIPIFAAILAALVFCTISEPANAQGQQQATPFSAQTCIQNLQNSYTAKAQALTLNNYKVLSNSPLTSMKALFCWDTIIAPLRTFLMGIHSSANGTNPLGAAIGAIVMGFLNSIITSQANQICGAVLNIVNSAFSFVKSLLCLPLPHFSGLAFNGIAGFSAGTCNGVNLLNLAAGLNGNRAVPPGAWGMWGLNKQY